MTKASTSASVALIFALSTTPAIAQYGSMPAQSVPQTVPAPQASAAQSTAAKKGISPSKPALKAFVDLQKAVTANDTANIPAKLAAVEAVATTPEDKYLLAQFKLKIAAAAHDSTGEAAALDAMAGSGFVDKHEFGLLYQTVGVEFYNSKQFDKAAAEFERAAALNPTDSQNLAFLGQTRVAQGQKAEAAAAFQRAIQVGTAAGQKPEENLYKLAVQTAYDADLPTTAEIARQWVAAYPGPDSWHNAVAIYRNRARPGEEGTVDLLRLLTATGAMTPNDYGLYATAVASTGNFVEARAVIDQGLASKQIQPSDPSVRDLIAALKTKPQASEADLDVAAKSATAGSTLIGIGDRFYGMGQYAKAADMYRTAAAKPGVDSNVANLHIGMALARGGDKAGATAALNAVSGPLGEIAKFWLLYVQGKA